MRYLFNKLLRNLAILIALLSLVVTGCRPTRLLNDDEYLLKKHKIKLENKEIDKIEMALYSKQKPNKRTLFGFYPQLSFYNFARVGKERKWKNWLSEKLGEEPVIYDSILTEQTVLQFKQFLANKSYYNAEIDYNVKLRNKRAKVFYKIKTGEPLLIENVRFNIQDTTISGTLQNDTINTLLKQGNKLLLSTLEQEQNRIVNTMKDSGYYHFYPEYVKYIIDSSDYKASIIIDIGFELVAGKKNKVKKRPHQRYSVKDVNILTNYNPQLFIKNKALYLANLDTIRVNNYNFIYNGKKPNVKPKLILKTNSIIPNSQFNGSLARNTHRHINSLKLFSYNNILFTKDQQNDTTLNCNIQLTPFTYQNTSLNFETTKNQGNIGVGGYASFQHRNLFRGAEILSLKVSGSVEKQRSSQGNKSQNIFEVGTELRLEIPSFLFPIKSANFYKNYYPKTIFSISYNKRHKPEQYTRNLFAVSAGYRWSKNQQIQHFLYPLEVSAVTLPTKTKAFADSIRGSYLEKNYQDYFIIGSKYIITNINNNKRKYKNSSFFRWTIETAGNTLHQLHKNTNIKDTVTGGHYELFKTNYAQFVKTDIDYRYHNYIDQHNYFVYRFFAGIGIPYGNSQAIPFIRQYSCGGAEGIRAWLARDLGPGTYKIADSLNLYPDQYGDIKLEANIEYRFDIIRSFKGALFLDAGNIWTLNDIDERQGGKFEFNQFYKQFALGSGLGIRYDFTFAIIRLDAGVKLRDPSIKGADSWVIAKQPFKWKHIVLNFAIGYPF